MILKSDFVTGLASFINSWPVSGITIGPFVFVSSSADAKTIQHERIHLAQSKELYFVGFWALYLYWWVKLSIEDSESSYYLNPFEMEAYRWESEPGYLWDRPPYAWRDYLGE
jgi:hypothetical protein